MTHYYENKGVCLNLPISHIFQFQGSANLAISKYYTNYNMHLSHGCQSVGRMRHRVNLFIAIFVLRRKECEINRFWINIENVNIDQKLKINSKIICIKLLLKIYYNNIKACMRYGSQMKNQQYDSFLSLQRQFIRSLTGSSVLSFEYELCNSRHITETFGPVYFCVL